MKLNEIVAPTIKELFIREIETLILSGQLVPGDKLPTEREMSIDMKISRTIVNLGMTVLAQKGFIKIVPRKGAFVCDYVKNGKLDTLIAIIQFNGGRFDKKTLHSIMEFRRLNEGEGAYLCAKYRTEQDLIELKEIYEKFKKSETSTDRANLLYKFHHVIFCASGNNIFPLIYNTFKSIILDFGQIAIRHCILNDLERMLHNLIVAIENGDGDFAKKCTLDLMDMGITNIKQNEYI